MNKGLFCFFSFFLLFVSAAQVFSQTPTSTPSPDFDETDVVKISTNLIQMDVTVTDKKGNPVTDLKAEDFEILENGDEQDITNFSFVRSGAEKTAVSEPTVKTETKSSVLLPPARLRPEQVRRTYAIVIDDLGLSFANMFWVKEALKKFINEQMQEGDLVAIIRVSGGIGALQSFSSDKRLLLAAAAKLRWNGLGRVGVNSFDPIRTTLQEDINGTRRAGETPKEVVGITENRQSEAKAAYAYQASSAIGTLGALNYVIRGMRELPGRKSLLLFSEGFSAFDYSLVVTGRSPAPENNRVYDSLKALAELANRSSVILYPLDPRGMDVPAMAQAQDDIIPSNRYRLRLREREFFDSQDSLRYLAEETGGIAYVNQNDLNKGIEQVLDDQKSYYLIGYQPDSETFKPEKLKFNKITVKVKRPGLKVRYRSGFFGVTDEKYTETNQTPSQKLAAAVVSPFAVNDISVELYSIFYNDEKDRNFIRSLLYINAKDLTFSQDDEGFYRAKFNVIAMIFDANGAAASNDIGTQNLKFTKEQFSKIEEKGFLYNLPVPITKSGAYQFRIALQDSATGKIGSASQFVEIPNLDKKQLTLSNLLIKNYSLGEWKKVSLGEQKLTTSDNTILLDTVTRQFKRGSVFTYSFVIYNAKGTSLQKPRLEVQTRLFRSGKMLLESDPSPVGISANSDLKRIDYLNAVTLGTDLQPGDYVLQVIVVDKLAKEKSQISAQSIDFEIVK